MSENAQKPEHCTILSYMSFSDLEKILETECRKGSYDAVIHAAAVSDYSPQSLEIDGRTFRPGEVKKIPSGAELSIRMKKNPKLLDSIKKWTGGRGKLVAFKLTNGATAEERLCAVKKILETDGAEGKTHEDLPDLVVSNDRSEITADEHPCTIYTKDEKIAERTRTLSELSESLERLILKIGENFSDGRNSDGRLEKNGGKNDFNA